MKRKDKRDDPSCADLRQVLVDRFLHRPDDGDGRPAAASGSPAETERLDTLAAHLRQCAPCQDELAALEDLDRTLRQGFQQMLDSAPESEQENIESTLGRLRRETDRTLLVRRLRRGLRVVLWGTFFGLTLVAACGLLVAVYRALTVLS